MMGWGEGGRDHYYPTLEDAVMSIGHFKNGTPSKVEETTVVRIEGTPGQNHGWECESCDAVSGLQWGDAERAQQALNEHLDEHGMGGEAA